MDFLPTSGIKPLWPSWESHGFFPTPKRWIFKGPWWTKTDGSGDCHPSFPGGFFHQKGAPWSNFFIKLWGDLMRLFTWLAPGRNPNGNRRNLRVCVKPCCRLCMVTFETITGGTSWTSMACGISCYNFLCVLVSNKSLWKNTYIYIYIQIKQLKTNAWRHYQRIFAREEYTDIIDITYISLTSLTSLKFKCRQHKLCKYHCFTNQ